MSVESVEAFFAEKGEAFTLLAMDDSTATVDEAAATLGVEADRIAKTLSFRLKDGVAIVVMSGQSRVDNKKFKAFFAEKACMLPTAEVEALTGHPVGGVCPFGLKEGLSVYLDESLKKYDTVFPAAGSPHHALEINPGKMAALTGARWADICK